MKHLSIVILRSALVMAGVGVLAICTLLLPLLWRNVSTEYPDYSYTIYGVFGALYIATIPFYIGLYAAWRLLQYITQKAAFTVRSVAALAIIARCAAAISLVYSVSMPFFYIWADKDDAPGLVIIGLVLVGAPLVVSIFAGLLRQLISEAIDIKSENELTV